MSMTRVRWLAAALCALLVACSGGPAPPTTPPPGAWLAMARGQVDVEGGLVHVVAQRDGQLASVTAQAGETVVAGAVLASLDQRYAEAEVATAEAALAEAEARARVARAHLPQARVAARRLGEAAATGAATGQAADEAQTNLAVLDAEAGAADAAVKMAHAQLAAARLELDAGLIRAPVAGRIVARSAGVGDTVSAHAGTPLFTLLPERQRIVRAELDEAWVDVVKPGMTASVVRDSGVGPSVQATVLRVGEVFGPSRLAEDPVERASAREVECVLELDEASTLRIGQRVLVRFQKNPG